MAESVSNEKKGLTIGQTVVVVLMTIIVISGAGYFIGEKFFWDQYDPRSVHEKQVEALEYLVKEKPDNLNNRVVLFDKLYGLGRIKEAEEQLKILQGKAKNHPDVLYREALLMWDKGDKSRTTDILKKVVKEKPFFVAARVMLAQSLAVEKQYGEALENLDFIIKVQPSAADVLLEKAKIYHLSGNDDAAKRTVDKVLSMIPDYKDALDLKSQLK